MASAPPPPPPPPMAHGHVLSHYYPLGMLTAVTPAQPHSGGIISRQQHHSSFVRAIMPVLQLADELSPECQNEDEYVNTLQAYSDLENGRTYNSAGYIAARGIQMDLDRTLPKVTRLDDHHYDDPEHLVVQYNLGDVTRYYSSNYSVWGNSNIGHSGLGGSVFNSISTIASPGGTRVVAQGTRFDLLSSLLSSPEMAVDICQYLSYKDILNLYSISQVFHQTFEDHSWLIVTTLGCRLAPESLNIFKWKLYHRRRSPARPVLQTRKIGPQLVPNPVRPGSFLPQAPVAWMAPDPMVVHYVEGMRYLGMVLGRENMVRDILACLARRQLRTPPGLAKVLKKMWLLMDVSHNLGRVMLINSLDFFTNVDLLNFQTFIIKLLQCLRDPNYCDSGGEGALCAILMGQRSGWYNLWRLLRGGFDQEPGGSLLACVQMKVRFDCKPTLAQLTEGRPIYGVPLLQAGNLQFEGWGAGRILLLRPDELVFSMLALRNIPVFDHINAMASYGVHDWGTGEIAVPSPEELYMHDSALPDLPGPMGRLFGNVPFHKGEWRMHMVLWPKWHELSLAKKLALWETREDDALKALPEQVDDNYDADDDSDDDSDDDETSSDGEEDDGDNDMDVDSVADSTANDAINASDSDDTSSDSDETSDDDGDDAASNADSVSDWNLLGVDDAQEKPTPSVEPLGLIAVLTVGMINEEVAKLFLKDVCHPPWQAVAAWYLQQYRTGVSFAAANASAWAMAAEANDRFDWAEAAVEYFGRPPVGVGATLGCFDFLGVKPCGALPEDAELRAKVMFLHELLETQIRGEVFDPARDV